MVVVVEASVGASVVLSTAEVDDGWVGVLLVVRSALLMKLEFCMLLLVMGASVLLFGTILVVDELTVVLEVVVGVVETVFEVTKRIGGKVITF